MLIYNLISYNIVCNTNKTTNANEIKALTRVESENFGSLKTCDTRDVFVQSIFDKIFKTTVLSRLATSQVFELPKILKTPASLS